MIPRLNGLSFLNVKYTNATLVPYPPIHKWDELIKYHLEMITDYEGKMEEEIADEKYRLKIMTSTD